jgi:hypothetical protein
MPFTRAVDGRVLIDVHVSHATSVAGPVSRLEAGELVLPMSDRRRRDETISVAVPVPAVIAFVALLILLVVLWRRSQRRARLNRVSSLSRRENPWWFTLTQPRSPGR